MQHHGFLLATREPPDPSPKIHSLIGLGGIRCLLAWRLSSPPPPGPPDFIECGAHDPPRHPRPISEPAPSFQSPGEGLLGGIFRDLPVSTEQEGGAEDDRLFGPVYLLESRVDSHAPLSSPSSQQKALRFTGRSRSRPAGIAGRRRASGGPGPCDAAPQPAVKPVRQEPVGRSPRRRGRPRRDRPDPPAGDRWPRG
jgi:hypothetical protein